MKEIEIEELKKLQLEILLKVHNFCISNGLRYSLGAGTLLGAIRHKGYIPWDDDIDIAMPRPDYNVFLQKFNGSIQDLYVISPELNWSYYAPYANVCDRRTVVTEGPTGHRGLEMGVKIDIFPIDGVPTNDDEFSSSLIKIRDYNRILKAKRILVHKFCWKQIRLIVSYLIEKIKYIPYSYSSIQKKLYSIVTATDFESSEYAQAWVYTSTNKRFKRNLFEHYTDVMFEGELLKAFKDYDFYLSELYGDYMKYPPLDQQIPHHNFKAYWKD